MNYLTIDIGGTITKYAVIDENHNFIIKDIHPTIPDGLAILTWIKSKVIELQNYNLLGIAISTGGVVDINTGMILYANSNIFNYTGLNLKQILESDFKIKTTVENDVNCFALAETKHHTEDFLMLTIGTGIGGAIVVNNQVYHGYNFKAGEFGQILINKQKFEDIASVKALVKKAQAFFSITSGKEVFDLYDQNNLIIVDIVDEFYHNLAIGLVNLAYIFNPKTIILGGGITNRPSFLNELTLHINKIKDANYFDQTQIKISNYQDDGGMIGALIHHLK